MPSAHWDCFKRATIWAWLFSVSALPFDQRSCFLSPSINETSIKLVLPLAEWQLIYISEKAYCIAFLSLSAGPPYPHPPQYSMSITLTIVFNFNNNYKYLNHNNII